MSLSREDRNNVNAMHHVANGTGSGASESSRKRFAATTQLNVIEPLTKIIYSSPRDDSGRPSPWKHTPSVIEPPGSQVSIMIILQFHSFDKVLTYRRDILAAPTMRRSL